MMVATAYILFYWAIVSGSSGDHVRDWRPMGEFVTLQNCNDGAKMLNLKPENFRCIPNFEVRPNSK